MGPGLRAVRHPARRGAAPAPPEPESDSAPPAFVQPPPPDLRDAADGVRCTEVEALLPWQPVGTPLPECILPPPDWPPFEPYEVIDPDTGAVLEGNGERMSLGVAGQPDVNERFSFRYDPILGNRSHFSQKAWCRHDAAGRVDLVGRTQSERCIWAGCEQVESGSIAVYNYDALGRVARAVYHDLTDGTTQTVSDTYLDAAGRPLLQVERWCPATALGQPIVEVGCTTGFLARNVWDELGNFVAVEYGWGLPDAPGGAIAERQVAPGGCGAPPTP